VRVLIATVPRPGGKAENQNERDDLQGMVRGHRQISMLSHTVPGSAYMGAVGNVSTDKSLATKVVVSIVTLLLFGSDASRSIPAPLAKARLYRSEQSDGEVSNFDQTPLSPGA
jgi:hypothetical protein